MRIFAALTLMLVVCFTVMAKPGPGATPTYDKHVGPFLKKYCVSCHTGQYAGGGIDFSKVKTAADAKKALRVMKKAAKEVKGKIMPPKGSTMPTAAERKAFQDWIAGQK